MLSMKPLQYQSVNTTKQYDQLLKQLYLGVKAKPGEVVLPRVNIIAVDGNEPPGGQQYQLAIQCLYGVGYTLKMGLKFGKLTQPKSYFDYKVGALETWWWSIGPKLEITNPKTLRWKAYLMVPNFVTKPLLRQAIKQAKEKHSDIPYDQVQLETITEGRAVQMLHIGPYDQEMKTVAIVEQYIKQQGLVMSGKHHEIYLSDPRRTKPDKLKTVIRYPVSLVKQ